MSSLSRTLLATSVIGSLTFAGYLWKDEQNQVDISFAQNNSDTPALITVEAEDKAQLLATSLSPVSTAATDALFGESPVRSALAAQTMLASATTDNDAERPVVPGRRMTRAVERLAHGSPTEIVEVIVGLDQLENLDPELLASLDADVTTGFKRLPFASVRLPAGELHTLSEATGVRVIDVNAEVSAASVSARDTAGVPKRGSRQYWASSGDVAIAVIASGVHPHADINLVRSIRCMNIGEDYLAGTGQLSNEQHVGVANNAPIVSIRVLNGRGRGTTLNVIAALDWVLANHEQYNIRVVNLSLGKGITESAELDPLVLAAEAVWDPRQSRQLLYCFTG